MLLMSVSGFNFTGLDCKGWMQETGFRHIHREPLAVGQSIVVGVRELSPIWVIFCRTASSQSWRQYP
jgi:hypothetical protein